MNSEDLRSLAGRAETIEGRQADRLAEVHDRIRTAQRRRAAAASAAVAGLILALVFGVSVVNGSRERSQDPVQPPTPTPTETESAPIPEGQFTQTADIGAGDIRGWRKLATRTNRQPEFLGATDLSMTVTFRDDGSRISEFCQGSPDTWYALTYGDGGQVYGRCSPDASTPVRPDFQDIGPYADPREAPAAIEIRMIVTKPTQEWIDCYTGGQDDCMDALPPLQPLDSTDAEFGFVVHDHPPVPAVLEVLGTPFEALTASSDGDEYLIETAVVAEADASTLVVHLDPSDRVRLVSVYRMETPNADQCRERHDTEGLLQDPDLHTRKEFAKLDRLCVAEFELRVDGQPSGHHDALKIHVNPPAALVPAGGAHEVTVNVVKNDPRNVRFAVVLWQARP